MLSAALTSTTEWTSQDGKPWPRSFTRSKSFNSMALRFLLLLRSLLITFAHLLSVLFSSNRYRHNCFSVVL